MPVPRDLGTGTHAGAAIMVKLLCLELKGLKD